MISRDSILRRLPPELDRKQALFLDGIRHAGEIAGLAYPRLQATLTTIAVEQLEPERADPLFTSAFLDAWSLVDVIDRFRALWLLLPDLRRRAPPPGTKTLAELNPFAMYEMSRTTWLNVPTTSLRESLGAGWC